jgi:predicted RNA-binding protein with PUA-like domain
VEELYAPSAYLGTREQHAEVFFSSCRYAFGEAWQTYTAYAGSLEGSAVAASANDLAGWLFKEEPSHYSFADLERDGTTFWDGVTNNLARQNLRKVQKGDRVLYYHTGLERAIVGEMLAVSEPERDPNDDDPKSVGVAVKLVRRLQHPVRLECLKADPSLATWALVRLPRLSVMPVTKAQWRRVEELGRKPS